MLIRQRSRLESGCFRHRAAGRFLSRQPFQTTHSVTVAPIAAMIIRGMRTGVEWMNEELPAAATLPIPSATFTEFAAMENTQMAWMAAALRDGRARRVEYFVTSWSAGALVSSRGGFNPSKEDILLTIQSAHLSGNWMHESSNSYDSPI